LKKESLRKEIIEKRKENWRPGGDELVMDMEWMESKPPPVSIKDRTVVGCADRV